MSKPEQESEKPKVSPEEIAKRKEALMNYYKSEVPFLTAQVEFEELQAKLMECRARQARADATIAQIYARPEPDDEPEGSNKKSDKVTEMIQPEEGAPKEPIIRKLKTE